MARMKRRKGLMLLTCMAVAGIIATYHLSNVRMEMLEPPIVLNTEVLPCTPKQNVVFLKTHKTAGSSIQNMFMRYGNKHGLLFVLPPKGNYVGHPYHFQVQMAPRLKRGHRYNIFTHHSRFNYRAMRALMPQNSVFVTVLRDPVTLFESLYSYYSLNKTYEMDIVEYAMANITDYLEHHNRRFYKKIGRNQMAFDLGVYKSQFDDEDAIRDSIERMDSQFDLVMISEMMDQSLVLLKHLLCWDTDDVVAFKHNARSEENRLVLGDGVKDRIRAWNHADDMIYTYFKAKLLERVAAFGVDRMAREVKELQLSTARWYQHCIEGESSGSELGSNLKAYSPYSPQVLGFKLKRRTNANSTCEDLAKAELPFTTELRRKQRSFLISSPSISPQYFLRTF